MMLALEATDRGGSLALADGGEVLRLLYEHGSRTHSERLMPGVDRLLEEASVEYEDVESVAACRGPGSFTAVRLAVTTAKTLAAVCDARLFGATSLRVMAEFAPPREDPVWSVIDARRGEFYVQSFSPDGGNWRARTDPVVVPPSTLRSLCEEDGSPVILYRGRGASPDWEGWSSRPTVLSGEAIRPLAAPLVSLAHRRLTEGDRHDPDRFAPCYVRASDARREASS